MMSITLTPDIEKRLKCEAVRHGLGAEEYARKLIVEHLPPGNGVGSLAEIFAAWDAQDATVDPAEIGRRNMEVEEFKKAMNRNREEMEGAESRRLYP